LSGLVSTRWAVSVASSLSHVLLSTHVHTHVHSHATARRGDDRHGDSRGGGRRGCHATDRRGHRGHTRSQRAAARRHQQDRKGGGQSEQSASLSFFSRVPRLRSTNLPPRILCGGRHRSRGSCCNTA
jgi:hypothetical protein